MKRYACLLSLLLLTGCHSRSPKTAQNLAPPTPPKNLAVRPYVLLKDGRKIEAGTAFGATLDGGKPILLSALHLFGDAGGLQSDIPPDSLPDLVQEVGLFDMEYGQKLGSAGKGLLRDGYPLREEGSIDCSGDLVAFELPAGTSVGYAPIAAQNPEVGERVWVVGKEYKQPGATANLYAGTVVEVLSTDIAVEEDIPFDGRGFSGGPVVNAKGELVGMVIGSDNKSGKRYSILNPIEAIRRRLKAAKAGQ